MDSPPLIRIDTRSHQAWQGDRLLRLTHLEFRMLCLLVARAGIVVTRDQILKEVWGAVWGPTKTIDTHMACLRHKLSDPAASSRYITTVRGVGFRLEADTVSPDSVLDQDAPLAGAGDVLAEVRDLLAGLAQEVARATERLAELERAHEEVTSRG